MLSIKLPFLRVIIERDGLVRLPNHALDTDSEWWASVFRDPRLRSRDDRNRDRLDRHSGEEMLIGCTKCSRISRYQIDDLIVRYGGPCPCEAAVAAISDESGYQCRRRDCGLTYKTTKSYVPPAR